MTNAFIAEQIANMDRLDALNDRLADLGKQQAEAQERAVRSAANREAGIKASGPQPVGPDERSQNPLRPTNLNGIIGQEKAKRMMNRVIEASKWSLQPVDHTLLVGAAGTGKTTFATCIGSELHVDTYQVAAPVSLDTLLELREVMEDRDILFVDEIHMQAVQERRGKQASTEPEVFLQLLEDRILATANGMVPFPHVTVIGATTDEGMLPDAFVSRFPLRPRLERYDQVQLGRMAVWNAEKLGLKITIDAALLFAGAARGIPRVVNNYLKNAQALCAQRALVDEAIAQEVLRDLNGVTPDGLTPDHQQMLTFLYTKGRRENAEGEVRYQASVGTLATALGKSRDAKAIALRVEPFLIEQGYVQVGHGGRILTDAGVARAEQLLTEDGV